MKTKRIIALLAVLLLLSTLWLPAFAEKDKTYRNVILMIGDGMGENHLHLAEQYGRTLFMNTQFDLRGQSRTRSLSQDITDSAAGGTALSCGVRIINQTVGVYGCDPAGALICPVSITEAAAERGMRTGIVTTDQNTGATPASFTVHTLYRKQYEKISQLQLATSFDLIWGAQDGYVTRQSAREHGFRFVATKEEMESLEPGTRSFGQFRGEFWRETVPEGCDAPNLAEMTVKAIDLLNEGNENGFFLMVEGAHIDKSSHRSKDNKPDFDNKRESVVDAVVGFDNAVKAAAEFARKDGHTVVLVTADHETGSLMKDRDGVYRFHTDEHTCNNVPVFVFGATGLFKRGAKVANYTIPIRLTKLLGWEKQAFPRMQAGTVTTKVRAKLSRAA